MATWLVLDIAMTTDEPAANTQSTNWVTFGNYAISIPPEALIYVGVPSGSFSF